MEEYDVIVVGGGHAGSEAATAAARLGARVLLVTSTLETIGQMSCNPAIGGVAKGIVVKEVDALGGVMGRATDRSTIQFRMLNRSKGPAVWSPRAQCDRGLYRRAVRNILEEPSNLRIWQGTVHGLILKKETVRGVVLHDGSMIAARAVILTAGTFLRGRIHVGREAAVPAGRAGDAPVVDLAEQLEALGLEVGRFKTGTPPRIDGRTVDFAKTERQDGDTGNYHFSHFESGNRPPQRPCWITWAGEELKEIIQENLQYSALYGGEIAGRGPRYCPSVEDKVVKFPNADRHQIFLEPEGLGTEELYVNGLSTSLPVGVQRRFLRSVPGLENVVMTRAGYAIEYDYYPPQQLTPWLEVKCLEGLFFAGQINGTTGYEEAAGQGVIAGINAVRRIRGEEPVVIPRDAGYIGVLVDDLITRGVDEPYRLFTSRAEYRLLLRQDNALKRIGELARRIGLLTNAEEEALVRRLQSEDRVRQAARETVVSPHQIASYFSAIGESQITEPQRLSDLVKRPTVELKALFSCAESEETTVVEPDVWVSVQVEFKYAGYIAREHEAARKLSEMANFGLPADLPYAELTSLSTEARQKLDVVRPTSLAQAGRIPGVSPSDLQNLIAEVLKRSRGREAISA